MSDSNNLERLNQMKSSVSERDMKIWENVAYANCLKKETEKLENEIQRMKTELVEKKKNNKILEEQLAELTNTLNIQRNTLKTTEQSVVLQMSLEESLRKEADDMKKKYDETLAMYNKELEDYRSIYENSSKSYQELKKLKVEVKRHQVEKMILDQRIASFEENRRQYEQIQEQIFHTTMIKLAEYCTLYNKNEETKKLVEEKKKEEQQLLKEHFRLADEVKQKMKQELIPKMDVEPTPEDQNIETFQQKKESDSDKFQKFFSEDYVPCSLTAIDSAQKTLKFNPDKSKVKVLDLKVIKPPVLKTLTTKPEVRVREKIENIMENTRKQVLKTNSLQLCHLEPQNFQSSSQNSQKESQPKSKPSQTKVQYVDSQNKCTPPSIKTVLSSVVSTKPQSQSSVPKEAPSTSVKSSEKTVKNLTPATTGFKMWDKPQSQSSVPKELSSTLVKNLTPSTTGLKMWDKPQSQSSVPKEVSSTLVKNLTPSTTGLKKDVATNSILKLSQEKGENISKFFTPNSSKKKTVTFQNELQKGKTQGLTQFELFSSQKNFVPATVVTDINIFQTQFAFKNEVLQKKGKFGTTVLPETKSCDPNESFLLETAPTNYATYGGDDTFEKRQDKTFDNILENSFNKSNEVTSFSPAFGQSDENFRQPDEAPTFSMFASQNKPNNPFGF